MPFYQNLNSLTGSGKTLILADAISQIRSQIGVEPIVLWLSKGKVVVWQTLTNLSSGKYTDLVSDFSVKPLMKCRASDIENPSGGLILVATVGKFNQADKEKGDRKVFQLALDFADVSLWAMLKARRDSQGRRRPFIIVYDEGHNLSDQQTKLLLDLDPDALIAASATMRIPAELGRIIARLRDEKQWNDNNFVTAVRSSEVVESGLVKQQIMLGGYVTPMEIAVNDLVDNMKEAEAAADHLGLRFKPKAIYVTNTNIITSGIPDNIHAPFNERQARPILIWRHLVENCGIDPDSIAVYCNLKFDAKTPPPAKFNLFSGGDNDYDNFIAGDFQHIIFNLTLQEGWDDPSCYFAYIDKTLGSRDQVTQIVGRVLRQPEAEHYPNQMLNTAHFYIRTDEKSVFNEVLREVQAKIASEAPEISLTVYTGGAGSVAKHLLTPRKIRSFPEIGIDTTNAKTVISDIVSKVQDYRNDEVNTVGSGGRTQVLQTIGANQSQSEEWIEVPHSNRVTARWIFVREAEKAYPKAINLCDIDHPKFDALLEYNSVAADSIRELAHKVVEAYITHSQVVHNSVDPREVPPVMVDPSNLVRFNSSLHEGYSNLNSFEREFAEALDRRRKTWFRNPDRGCFEIPLLVSGGSKTFNPDFLVWADKGIIAIDTKGDHLIVEDAGRKLFSIEKIGTGPDISIRLLTRGKWNSNIEKIERNGFTVWSLKNGKPYPVYTADVNDAVTQCLK